jgi:fatty-acyl-CoA synthase
VRATAAEIARLLTHGRAVAILTDDRRAALGREAAALVGVAAYVCEAGLPLAPRLLRRARRRPSTAPEPPRAEAVAMLAYTSGTTGAPKGVMLTHANLFWSTLACAQARGDSARTVGACLSPLTHAPVLVSHLLCRILVGASAILVEKFDVEAVLEVVERFGVTDLPLIGGMVFDVVRAGRVPDAVRRSIRKVSVGAAPTPIEAKEALARIFEGAELIEAYGQTEATDGVTMARGTSVLERPGTVGTANPHVVVSVRRGDEVAEPGQEGEIVVWGPTVMAGYYRDHAATKATIRDGWLHTGDLGRRDEDGYLFVTGRVKDIIITGGENVSPGEVEEALRRHPDVVDVAVIGTPHPRWGEQVTAVIVRRDGSALDVDSVDAFASRRLAGFKKPRRIEFVAALPRNAANKVETHVLRRQFGS